MNHDEREIQEVSTLMIDLFTLMLLASGLEHSNNIWLHERLPKEHLSNRW